MAARREISGLRQTLESMQREAQHSSAETKLRILAEAERANVEFRALRHSLQAASAAASAIASTPQPGPEESAWGRKLEKDVETLSSILDTKASSSALDVISQRISALEKPVEGLHIIDVLELLRRDAEAGAARTERLEDLVANAVTESQRAHADTSATATETWNAVQGVARRSSETHSEIFQLSQERKQQR